jgi:hypothetical protein
LPGKEIIQLLYNPLGLFHPALTRFTTSQFSVGWFNKMNTVRSKAACYPEQPDGEASGIHRRATKTGLSKAMKSGRQRIICYTMAILPQIGSSRGYQHISPIRSRIYAPFCIHYITKEITVNGIFTDSFQG